MHWQVEPALLQPFLPENAQLHLKDGYAWVSMVAFRMEKLHPKGLFPVSLVSDFEELNIRTYVEHEGKGGVYFISIEAQKALSCFLARQIAKLPYWPAVQKRISTSSFSTFTSSNLETGFSMQVEYEPGSVIPEPSALDLWLTERYCLYHPQQNEWMRYEIHHAPWTLRQVALSTLKINYLTGQMPFNRPPDLVHFSEGVKVVSWPGRKLS